MCSCEATCRYVASKALLSSTQNFLIKYHKKLDLSNWNVITFWQVKKLAEESGVSAGYLCHLEKGKRDNPSIEVMENIAKVLGKTIPEVFFSN